ncbi:MAG: hypothetical protein DRI95_14435 [Bacteroidetes bacterium]|nr:MAG: hypothetical protein DRI95_14435 [Bacteroidota bacterium]
MFYLLSKIFSFLFSPLNWVFILLITAFFIKINKWKKNLIYIAIATLYLFSNSYIFHITASKWNIKPIKLKNNERYKYAIVLGGMANFDEELKRIKFSVSVDRLLQALSLYKTGYIENIIISGGSGSILYPEMLESEIVRSYLLQIGIQESDILIENRSKNTRQNALFTSELLGTKNHNETCLLITSSSHMRRAIGCFEKTGIKTHPYPTNQLDSAFKFSLGNFLLPDPAILNSWKLLIHEIAGYMIYRIKGYI